MSDFIFVITNSSESISGINWDAVSAVTTLVVAVITLGTIFWQIWLQYQQKKINKHQADLQRCSFVYDSFIREKQEKLIELRRNYIEFKDKCLYLLETIFPCSVSPTDLKPGEFPILKIDDDTLKSYYHKSIWDESADTFLENGQKTSTKLLKYLKENEVFLQDNPVLFDDLQIISNAFNELFVKIKSNDIRRQNFIKLASFIDDIDKNLYHVDNKERQDIIVNMRSFFYNFIHHKIMLHRGNVTEWMLNMPQGSIFKSLNMPHTAENMQKWSQNELIAFHTLTIFYTWFNETWLKYIDEFFSTSFNDIRKVVKNDAE